MYLNFQLTLLLEDKIIVSGEGLYTYDFTLIHPSIMTEK